MKKVFRKVLFAVSMLKIKLLRLKPFPLYVNLAVNSKCNLDCVYCFGGYPHRKEQEYTLDEIKALINDLHKLGTRYILIQGGEPFIRKDLDELIDFIDKKGIIPAVVTNGTLVKRIKGLKNLSKLDNICFSLDGMKQGNDAQRGKGVFDKVIRSIEEVRKCCPSLKIRTNAVITSNTVDSFKEYLDFCWARGIEVQASLMFKGSPLAADREKLDDLNNFIYEAKKRGAKVVASTSVLKYVRDWPFDKIWVDKADAVAKLGIKAIECQYGKYELIVDSNGNIYPCNAMQGIFHPLNFKEVGLEKALQHLQTKPCYTCNIASLLDTSEVINWKMKTIIERVLLELRR